MIWGLTLEPGKLYTEIVQDEVQLSMASLESRRDSNGDGSNFSHVVMATNNAEYLLCTLVNGATYQQNLDLKIMPQEKVTFSVQGASTVYLMGYSMVYPDVDQEEGVEEAQGLPGWEECSVDDHRDNSGIPEEVEHSKRLSASLEQGQFASSETPQGADELSSSVGLLVESWTRESPEDEENFYVESIKPEQSEGGDVFPIANVKEEPTSPPAVATSKRLHDESHLIFSPSNSSTSLEVRGCHKDPPYSVSSSWPVQVDVAQGDTGDYDSLSREGSRFLSEPQSLQSGEHSSLPEALGKGPDPFPAVATSCHSMDGPGFTEASQVANTTAPQQLAQSDRNSPNRFIFPPLSNPRQQLSSNAVHSVPQQATLKVHSLSARGHHHGRGPTTRGHRIRSRGSIRGVRRKFVTNTGRGKPRVSESFSSLSPGWPQPSSEPSFVRPFQADGQASLGNQSQSRAGHSGVATGQAKHHVCPICQKTFVTMSLLKRHHVIHTGLKPHKCPMCPSSFARNDNLLRHLKNNHKEAYTYFRGGLKNS